MATRCFGVAVQVRHGRAQPECRGLPTCRPSRLPKPPMSLNRGVVACRRAARTVYSSSPMSLSRGVVACRCAARTGTVTRSVEGSPVRYGMNVLSRNVVACRRAARAGCPSSPCRSAWVRRRVVSRGRRSGVPDQAPKTPEPVARFSTSPSRDVEACRELASDRPGRPGPQQASFPRRPPECRGPPRVSLGPPGSAKTVAIKPFMQLRRVVGACRPHYTERGFNYF